jgi:ribonuclease D
MLQGLPPNPDDQRTTDLRKPICYHANLQVVLRGPLGLSRKGSWMTAFQYVDTTRKLEQAAAELANSPFLYIDTEFEQRGPVTQFCLLQVSNGESIFVIDMLELSAMDSLGAVLADPNTTWVIHAAKTDVELLNQRFRIDKLPKIFDTQIAWGLLGAEYSVALAYLNYRLLGERLTKEHQVDPWARRPIPPSQLQYAAEDVVTLPDLHRLIHERLVAAGKENLVFDVSLEYCFPPERKSVNRTHQLSLDDYRHAWQLDYGGLAALQYLIDWWNSTPANLRPNGLTHNLLFYVARRLPESGKELAQIKGIPRAWAREEGDKITGRVIRASYEAKPGDFPLREPKPYNTYDEAHWEAFVPAVRYAVSRSIEIAPEICFPSWSTADHIKEQIIMDRDIRSGANAWQGWRQKWLTTPYHKFCETWESLGKPLEL